MKKYFGNLLIATSLTFMGMGIICFTGCGGNPGVAPGAPGAEEPEEVLSEEEEAAEEGLGVERDEEEG